jgi:serine/threonine-protein kinase
MAVVFAVTHRNGRRFALKMLYPEYSVRGDLRKRFLREGYIANAVGHPGAVAVLDDDVAEDGSAFLVMELLDGEGLDDVLDRNLNGLPPLAALSASYQLLDTLIAAHAKNIVHRDIKPGNLFAIRGGELKVLDFGIARLQDPEGKTATRSGVTLGTPAFMAPEQAKGKTLDARADLYSVGATLFTLLSGRLVHEADNAQELMIKAATEHAPKLASIAPHIPSPVGEIVDRALAFHLAERWQSAVLMKAAVAHAVEVLTGGGAVSPSYLAPLLARSRAAEIYSSVPEAPPPGAPTEPPPTSNPAMARLALEATSPSAPTLARESAPAPAGENASSITAEPVATTPSPSGSPQGSTPPKGMGRGIGVVMVAVLAVGAVVLALRFAGRGSTPSPSQPSSAAATLVTGAPTESGPASASASPALSSAVASAASAAPSAPAPIESAPHAAASANASALPRTTVRPPSRTTAPATSASPHGAPGTPNVDPWGTR